MISSPHTPPAATSWPAPFFTSVPDGAELYLLKSVHDWADDRCATILANCRAAMNGTARLAIVEFMLTRAHDG